MIPVMTKVKACATQIDLKMPTDNAPQREQNLSALSCLATQTPCSGQTPTNISFSAMSLDLSTSQVISRTQIHSNHSDWSQKPMG